MRVINKLINILFSIKDYIERATVKKEEKKPEKKEKPKTKIYWGVPEDVIQMLPTVVQEEIGETRALAQELEIRLKQAEEEIKRLKGLLEEKEKEEIVEMAKELHKLKIHRSQFIRIKASKPIFIRSWRYKYINAEIYVGDVPVMDYVNTLYGFIITPQDGYYHLSLIGLTLVHKKLVEIPIGPLQYLFYYIKEIIETDQGWIVALWIDENGNLITPEFVYKKQQTTQQQESITEQQANQSTNNNQTQQNTADPPSDPLSNMEKYYSLAEFEDILKTNPRLREFILDLLRRIDELEGEVQRLKSENRKLTQIARTYYRELIGVTEDLDFVNSLLEKVTFERNRLLKTVAMLGEDNLKLGLRVAQVEGALHEASRTIEEQSRRIWKKLYTLPEEFMNELIENIKKETRSVVKDELERILSPEIYRAMVEAKAALEKGTEEYGKE